MVTLLRLLSLITLSSPLQPATDLTGTVRTESGSALINARIVLLELQRETESDSKGAFHLTGLPDGHYTLVVSHIGYASSRIPVDFPMSRNVDVQLKSSPMPLQPVVVTAERGMSEQWGAAQPTSVLTGEQLERNQSVAVASAIHSLPGVRSLSTGMQIGKPVIRGLSGQRILVLDQGHRMEDYSWSDEDGPSIDAAGPRRIEVVRGPASLLYGSDAIGGVVNALDTPLPDARGLASFHRGETFFSAASNNVDAGLGLRYEGGKGGFGYRLGGVARYAASLHTPDGELDNTGFGSFNGEAAFGLRGERSDVALRVVHYGGEFKLLEANGPPPGEEEGEEEGPERKAGDLRVQLDANHRLGQWSFQAHSQFQSHSLIEVSDDAGGTPGQESEAFNLLLNTASLDLTAQRMMHQLHLTLGGSFSHQTNDTKGPIPLVPDGTISGLAAFGLGEVNLQHFTVSGGVRVDKRHLDAAATEAVLATDTERDHSAVSAGAGIAFRPTDHLSLTAHYGRAWRAPNLFELFSDGPHLGDARFEIGDANLIEEKSHTLEGGVQLRNSVLIGAFNIFDTRIDNYLFISPTGATQENLPVYQHMQADAKLTGFEAELDVNPVHAVTLHGQVDGVRATNLGANEPLPLTPPMREIVGVEFHGQFHGERSYLGADVEHFDRQDRLNPLDLATDGYTLIGIHAGAAVHLGSRLLRLDLAAQNLANTRYRDFLSRYKAFALNPGRDIRVRLTTSF